MSSRTCWYLWLYIDQLRALTKNRYTAPVPVLFIDKYLFKEVTAIKMRACLWVGRTTTAIHSFDDFIWTRELSACDNALLFTLR